MSNTSLVSVNQTALLTNLLPSTTYTLAYALPLLLSSLCLTFAGAFLTLDRSRSFPPSYDSIPGDFFPRKATGKLHWLLEGGIGGLAAGYVFGIHLSTFLSLMIPSLSTSAPLTSKSFLPVWLLSAVATSLASGRWKYCALVASGISGGASFALALSVMLHPSLLARIIVIAIFVPIVTILALLPISRCQHSSLRFALSSTGAFGVILSISLLAHIDSWANVWERLWISVGPTDQWGSSQEKGLSAAYCFLLVGGIGCDWILKRQFGENPDQKWDSYLAHYSQNLPDRAGQFQPLASIWTRLFGGAPTKPPVPDEVIFPNDDDLKSSISSPLKLQKRSSISKSPIYPGAQSQFQPPPIHLKKGRSQRTREKVGKRTRDPVKFGADVYSSDSDSEEDNLKTPLERPWLEKRQSSSVGFSASLRKIQDDDPIDVEKEMTKVKVALGGNDDPAPDYSDFEDDVTSAAARDNGRDSPNWSPEFLRRHQESGGSSTTSLRTAVERPGAQMLSPPAPNLSAPEGAVPITPSLIKAFDRIATAQEAAFGSGNNQMRPGLPSSKSSEPAITSGLPKAQIPPVAAGEPFQAAKWDNFWQDVRQKAGNGR